MGDFSYGLLRGYSSTGRYSKITILLLSLLGIFSSLGSVYGAACSTTLSTTCTAPATPPCQSDPNCPVPSSYGCATGSMRCVNQTQAVTFPLCGIYGIVHNVVFLLGIVLIILGGALYAGANVMPGQSKGAMQGYGMGFVMGGIIGVIIAMLAPFIISLVSSGQAGGFTISTVCK